MPSNQWLTNEAQPIVAGWPGPPQLSAPNIGGLVEAILRNKLARERDFQGNIAETIKNVRQERQSNKYLDAMKAARLISQDYDAGGLGGATMGTSLAKLIQAQTDQAEQTRHQKAMEGYTDRRLDIAEDWAGTAADEPETYTDPQGVTWRRTKSGWTPMPTGLQPTDVRTETVHQVTKEQQDLEALQAELEDQSKQEEAFNIEKQKAGVPFSRSAEYGRTKQRLEEIKRSRTQPRADQTGGGDIDVIKLRAEAQDAISKGADPEKVKQRFHDQTGGVL